MLYFKKVSVQYCYRELLKWENKNVWAWWKTRGEKHILYVEWQTLGFLRLKREWIKGNLGQILDLETTEKPEGNLKMSGGTETLFSLLF